MKKILLALSILAMVLAADTLAQGPLTNLMNLRVRTDANGYLITSGGTYTAPDGPLTALANLRGRTDANGYLLTTLNGPSTIPTTSCYGFVGVSNCFGLTGTLTVIKAADGGGYLQVANGGVGVNSAFLQFLTGGASNGSNFRIQTVGRVTGQIAANASVATFTVGAADGTFEVSSNVLVTTATTHSFGVSVAFTDEGNTGRTYFMNFTTGGGQANGAAAVVNANGTIAYAGNPLHIRAKAGTAITIATSGTFTTVVYNVEGIITQKA